MVVFSKPNLVVQPQQPNLRQAWYTVIVLMLAYVSSFIDRQILGLLVGPIQRDMKLTDTEISLLMGFSFAIFYTFLGIPIGRLADRRSRKWIITVGVVVWSAMTTLCGTVKNYGQFFLARIGVGVGEATLSPAAFSIITDYFPKDKLATALSVYSMGIYLGSGFAVLIGAALVGFTQTTILVSIPFVGDVYAWQTIFFYIGIVPGALIVLLMFTVKEPARRQLLKTRNADGVIEVAEVSVAEVLHYINANRTAFLCVCFGVTFVSTFAYGSAAWIPTYFIRNFGWSAGKIGLLYGSIVTVFSTLGVYTGGRLADYWGKKGQADAKLRVGLIAGLGVFGGCVFLLIPNPNVAILFVPIPCFFVAFPLGAGAAAIQEMMPNQMRALASSIYFFILNLIGLGFGPTFVAVLTDYVFQNKKAVGSSLFIVAIMSGSLAYLCFRFGRKPYLKSLEYLKNYMNASVLP